MSKVERPYLIACAVVLAIGLGGLLVRVASPSQQDLLITVLLFAYWATVWNILGGMAGQLSFGNAIFIGTGAYTSSILFIYYGITPWFGMLVGAALATFIGLFIGYLCFRYGLRDVYFSLTTLALGEVVYLLIANTYYHGKFGGHGGVRFPIMEPSSLLYQFPNKVGYYYVIAMLLAFAIWLTWWMRRSKIGYYLIAIRENERSAQAAGVSITRYKLIATGLNAFLSALGGTFYAQYYLFIDPPSIIQTSLSIAVLLPAIVGGFDTVLGPLVGSIILMPISEQVRNLLSGGLAGSHLVVYGLVIILVMRFIPQGLVGWIKEQGWFADKQLTRAVPHVELEKGGDVGSADLRG